MNLKKAKIGETFLTKQKGDATLQTILEGKYKFITVDSKICFECNELGRSKSGTGAYDIIGKYIFQNAVADHIVSEEEFLNFNVPEYFSEPISNENFLADQCNELKKILCNDRAQEYGDQKYNFEKYARIATEIINQKEWDAMSNKKILDTVITKIMISIKLGRESHKHKDDNMLDASGYSLIQNHLENS